MQTDNNNTQVIEWEIFNGNNIRAGQAVMAWAANSQVAELICKAVNNYSKLVEENKIYDWKVRDLEVSSREVKIQNSKLVESNRELQKFKTEFNKWYAVRGYYIDDNELKEISKL